MIVRVFKIKFNVMQNFLSTLSCFIFCVILSSLLKKNLYSNSLHLHSDFILSETPAITLHEL